VATVTKRSKYIIAGVVLVIIIVGYVVNFVVVGQSA
jgi:hypothetical protein